MTGENPTYWKSPAERGGGGGAFQCDAEDEFPEMSEATRGGISRRAFLRAAGFAFAGATLAGCQRGPLPRAPVQHALPYLAQPEEVTPGRALYYASTCSGCSAGCGLLVKNRDGRPIKLEGNPEHPLSRGGLCAVGQASILGLYDRLRLQQPMINGNQATWAEVDRDIRSRLEDIRSRGGAVRVLSGTITSPTTRRMVDAFLSQFHDARHVVHDPLSCSAILDAHERTHGCRLLPRYRFESAQVIISFDADFLGTWISPVEFTASYRAGRSLQGTPPRCSYHVQFEARLSLTGSKADQRFLIAPGELGLVLTHLAARVATRAAAPLDVTGIAAAPVPAESLDHLADRLWQARRHALVVCGSQDPAEQILCNYVNHLLGDYGAALDLNRPSYQRQGSDREMKTLLEELHNGRVSALFILDRNLVFDLPQSEGLAADLRRVPLLVHCGERLDETARLGGYVCPHPHFLASWGDAEAVNGVVSLGQPTMRPLENSRPILESLAAWMGTPRSALTILREHWQHNVYSRKRREGTFQAFWDQAVHDGFVEVTPQPALHGPFNISAVRPVLRARPATDGTHTLVLYPKVGMLDGSQAFNPWLQELPDPLSKITWDNYACLSPAAAARLEVADGDVVRLEAAVSHDGDLHVALTPRRSPAIELPVFVQPGQHDDVVAVALGYGSAASARFADIGPPWLEGRPTVGENGLVGTNAAPFLSWQGDLPKPSGGAVRITKTGRKHPLASTQSHHTIAVPAHLVAAGHERPPLIRQIPLPVLTNAPMAHPPAGDAPDLWPADHPETGHRWGMVIDLNACTGCSACVIACQVENNTPVVGKDEVRRQREMHWLRIDRYYSESGLRSHHAPRDGRQTSGVDVSFQPMLCQHCGNAPCETVCPVLASVHSAEGLNQQVYNRCVGTRYCANNCPYKVRRFNWFDYPRNDQLQNLVLNPDVTVRSRGVMEKCTFCVQRIQEAKLEARRQGIDLADGAVQTACQQSCPAQAIVFGDMNDSGSKVARLMRDRRRYQVLADLNVRPAVSYLGVVRNRPVASGRIGILPHGERGRHG